MEEQFSSWLERNKPKSQRHYISGYRTINSLLENNNLQKLNLWNSSNWESNLQSLSKIEKFKNLNSTGNNILTATLSNLKKIIMSEDIKQDPPALPFKKFCWRWASTGIASHLNKPNNIRPLLDAILINGNGENNYTHSFKELLERICLKKYKLSEEDLKKIVIPFSAIYKKSRIKELTEHVVNNRKNPDLYYQWPDCYSHLIDNKGERMINEFLYFLECFGFLHSESEKIRENNKRYYATSVLQKLLIKNEVIFYY